MDTFKDRRKKYSRKSKQDSTKIRFNFDLTIMDLFCAYVLSENMNIHRNSLMILRDVFKALDETIFENNPACILRYRFCQDVLETKLIKNITSRDLVIRDVMGMIGDKYADLSPQSFREVTNDDVVWVEKTISSCSNLLFINNSVAEMGNLCNEFIATDYIHKEEVAKSIESKVAEMQSKFRRNSVDSDDQKNTINLMTAKNSMIELYDNVTRPRYKLRTGMHGLNGILAGGFEGGRVYSLFGLPSDGKTITLLNIAYQIKKYNKDYICKDKTKIPCVVVLTMENTAQEALNTLFNIACDNRPLDQIPKEEALGLLDRELGVHADDPINIIVRYKPINSVDTSYLYKLTEDLADEGYEVICMIQDYIKRIRPEDYTRDMRIDLGNVINDFRNYAIFYGVPVLTASQFNRDAVRTIDESRNSNRHDLVTRVGRAMIGESGLIDENLDGSIFITREEMPDGQNYMGFRLTKKRYRIFTNVTTFYQPFHMENRIKYVEDVGCTEPAYRTKLIRDEKLFKEAFGETIKLEPKGEIKEIIDDMVEFANPNITPSRRENLENSILGGNVIGAAYDILDKVCNREFGFIKVVKRVEPIKPRLLKVIERV
jgi:hypothetical protein|nr:MAG TPA: DNA polymerase B Like Replicative Helicase [Caudoviricetes sp.]